jgi:hypothetical protein
VPFAVQIAEDARKPCARRMEVSPTSGAVRERARVRLLDEIVGACGVNGESAREAARPGVLREEVDEVGGVGHRSTMG